MIVLFLFLLYNSIYLKTRAEVYVVPVAGYGGSGYLSSGDNGPATLAIIRASKASPWVDSNGNIYIPETPNYVIRKVDVNGIITTIAGNGLSGTAGGSGPALSTRLYQPLAIVGDNSKLYLSDQQFIWVYDFTNGIISVIAGTSTDGATGDGGPAVSAQLSTPKGIWLTTSSALYIADYGNHKIRRIISGIITTFAGTGSPGTTGDGGAAASATLTWPNSVYVDTAGIVFIANTGSHNIRRVDGNNIISTIAWPV
jgi:hypothetical protein